MWISLGNFAEVALIFAQTDPEKKHRGIACFLVPTEPRASRRRRSTASSGCGPPTPPRSALDDVEVADDALLGRGRRRLQDRDDGARLRPLLGRRRLRRDLRGLRRRLGRLREGAPAVRRPDRQLPARPGDDRRHDRAGGTRRGCWSGAPGSSRTRASRTPPRPRSRSSTRPRPRSSARTWRSRCTAAPATSTTTRSSATCATPA